MHRPLNQLIDFNDFEIYAKALVNSKDVDPVYPFLKEVIAVEGFNPVDAVFWYGYFYSIESMVRFLRHEISFAEAKYGIERGRTPQVRRPENMAKTVKAWNDANMLKVASEASNSREFAAFLTKTVPYFGGWVSYKYTELFEKVLGYTNLAPSDMNVAAGNVNGNGGPCGGLRCLYGPTVTYTTAIVPEWEELGKTLSAKWGYDLGEIETVLCKYRKLTAGNYYIGHDIAELKHCEGLWSPEKFKSMMLNAGFHESLWSGGLVKKNKIEYKKNRLILNSQFA
jgi:hypothetical protein